jgi:hypothetical protein
MRRTYTVAWVGVPSVMSFSPRHWFCPFKNRGDDDLFTLSGETRAEVVGDSLRGFESGGCEFAGAQSFSEFKGSLDLCDLCRPNAGNLEQIMSAGAVQSAKPSKIPQNREGCFVDILSRHALFERPQSDAKDDGEQLSIGQPFGAFCKESLARALLCGPGPDAFRADITLRSLCCRRMCGCAMILG